MKKKIVLIAAICIPILSGHISTSFANNLSIKSGSVSGSNVIFTVSWDNSWYNNTTDNPNNWDAVWVFVKYKNCDSTKWSHADLSKTSGDHVVASPLKADAVTDGKGVFLRRSAVGKGNISSVLCTLKLATITSGSYDFRIFGIEMVYAPQDSFKLGDGVSGSTFNSITITSSVQSAGLTSAVLGGGTTVNVPATYPMGYNAIYCMKYEITQEQYADFLNTLSYEQQATRTVYAPSSGNGTRALTTSGDRYRNNIEIKNAGFISFTPKIPAVYGCDLSQANGNGGNGIYDEATDGQNIACNFLSWADLSAYLDWAALRPMSDFEFEKICRGKMPRVDREYVWGSSANLSNTITKAYSYQGWGCGQDYGMSNVGAPNETAKSKGNGLCAYGIAGAPTCNGTDQQGPLRVGFAADSTGSTTRVTTGAAYYGAMDMGGNVWERVVAVNTKGVAFTGSLGDGKLDNTTGDANQSDWPATDANGAGFRGGNWYDGAGYAQTSERGLASTTNAIRTNVTGGRGVR